MSTTFASTTASSHDDEVGWERYTLTFKGDNNTVRRGRNIPLFLGTYIGEIDMTRGERERESEGKLHRRKECSAQAKGGGGAF